MARTLIVGAGIAGDALAVLLGRAATGLPGAGGSGTGWDVTVVELAPALRTGGQTVDLRGDSRATVDRMGLLGACRQRLVPQRGAAWIDATGRPLAAMPVEAFGGRGLVSSHELLRSDLSRILHDAAGPRVTHRFGDTVTHLEPRPGGVRATFRNDGATEDFDLVVGADGTHSRVRELAFGPETAYRRPLGLAHAWFTLTEQPGTPALDGWFLMHQAPGSRVVEARPGRPGEQEIGFTFPATGLPPRAERFALLDATFAGVGWRTPKLLAAARVAPDFAFDTYDQIDLEGYHRSRVVLLGDSAWCASPLSGLGTALALRGAEALAGALTTAPTVEDALTRYEATMRPRVTAAQRMFPGRVSAAAPRTVWGIRANALAMRLVQSRPVAAALSRLMPGPETATLSRPV
ncbi:FAD-dependent monooxygenase [Actinoplanes sp. NPDC051494]|uniref:FAD-dependent monooxygenase n=1 Tax=Actinoplanes sp. NPDC051494 TaxID=3363907 RepID=UPI0037AF8883